MNQTGCAEPSLARPFRIRWFAAERRAMLRKGFVCLATPRVRHHRMPSTGVPQAIPMPHPHTCHFSTKLRRFPRGICAPGLDRPCVDETAQLFDRICVLAKSRREHGAIGERPSIVPCGLDNAAHLENSLMFFELAQLRAVDAAGKHAAQQSQRDEETGGTAGSTSL